MCIYIIIYIYICIQLYVYSICFHSTSVHRKKQKKKHVSMFQHHLLIVPPKLRHYPTFRCFHFWHSSKTKNKKHAPPGFRPGNPCENLDPNAKPPRPQPTGKTTQPDGFTAQATYAADLIGGETAQDLQVR